MSQSEEASTASTEPSLIAMTNRKPRTISTTVWVTAPPSKIRAAPWVRLDSPEATAASWSARSRGKPLDTASSRPSEETTTVCATPGTRSTKLVISQLRFWAAWLSSLTVVPFPNQCLKDGSAKLRPAPSCLLPPWRVAASRPWRSPRWKLDSLPRTSSAERAGIAGGVALAAPVPPAEPGTRLDLGTRLGRPFWVRPAATGFVAAWAARQPSSPGDDQAAEPAPAGCGLPGTSVAGCRPGRGDSIGVSPAEVGAAVAGADGVGWMVLGASGVVDPRL